MYINMTKKYFSTSDRIILFFLLFAGIALVSCNKEQEYSPEIIITAFDADKSWITCQRIVETTVVSDTGELLTTGTYYTISETSPTPLEEVRIDLGFGGHESSPDPLLYGRVEDFLLDWLLSHEQIRNTSIEFKYCPEQVTDINFYLDDDERTCINSSVEIIPAANYCIASSSYELLYDLPERMTIEDYLSLKPLLSSRCVFQFANPPVETPAEIRIIVEVKLGNGTILSNTTQTLKLL